MMNYYNEWDKGAVAWLRELIKAGLIPDGYVDDRSITEVTPSDLEGFTQCHFFAGIGGWSYALQLAGIPATTRLWTGSPPCQPFSVAGKQLGQLDERHLAPTFMRLVGECQPPVIFGEQVAAAIKKHWLDDLFVELERQGYACGASVLPACSVGAPHKRDRLFFGASLLEHASRIGRNSWWHGANTGHDGEQSFAAGKDGYMAESMRSERNSERLYRPSESNGAQGGGAATESTGCGYPVVVADTFRERLQRCSRQHEHRGPERWEESLRYDGASSLADELANTQSQVQSHGRAGAVLTESSAHGGECCAAGAYQNHSFWSDADWLGCRDGKFRPVESGTFPLANGIPARVGRLRGYGNAIVPQVAAEFIKAFMFSI